MILDRLVFIFVSLIFIILLSIRYIKRYAPENLIVIPFLALSLGLYICFAIYNVYIPIYFQIPIFIFSILIPMINIFLQYNNIVLSRKILYYIMKYEYKSRDYEKTIECIKKLVTLEGRKAEYLYLLGQCYKHTGDFINSRDCFALAVELDSNDYKSYYELGLVLDETNKKENAMVMFNNALRANPDFYEAKEALGICLTSQGKFEEAVLVYKDALKKHPESYEIYYNIAMIESELGKYDEAIGAFENAGRIKPDLYMAFYNLGKLYYSNKEYDKAIEAYSKMLNSTLYGPKAYYNLAIVYATKADFDRAMTTLEYAMELDEKYIKKADTEYIFNPFRSLIEDYKKAKEKEKIKQIQKHNFMEQRLRIFKPKEIEENTEYIETENIQNHA